MCVLMFATGVMHGSIGLRLRAAVPFALLLGGAIVWSNDSRPIEERLVAMCAVLGGMAGAHALCITLDRLQEAVSQREQEKDRLYYDFVLMEKSFRRLSNEAGAPAGAPDSNAASSSSGAPDDEEAAAAPDGLALALLQRRGVGGAGPSGLVAASDAAGYPSPASHHTAKCSPPEGSESGRATCGDAGDLGTQTDLGYSPPTAATFLPPSALPTLFGRCGGGGRSGSAGSSGIPLYDLSSRQQRADVESLLAQGETSAPPPSPAAPRREGPWAPLGSYVGAAGAPGAASGSGWPVGGGEWQQRVARLGRGTSSQTSQGTDPELNDIYDASGRHSAAGRRSDSHGASPPKGRRSSLSPVVGSLPGSLATSPPKGLFTIRSRKASKESVVDYEYLEAGPSAASSASERGGVPRDPATGLSPGAAPDTDTSSSDSDEPRRPARGSCPFEPPRRAGRSDRVTPPARLKAKIARLLAATEATAAAAERTELLGDAP